MKEIDEILDRQTYRRIKQMSREEMAQTLNKIYTQGVNSVKDDRITKDELEQRLNTVKGLGEKRISDILAVLSDLYAINE